MRRLATLSVFLALPALAALDLGDLNISNTRVTNSGESLWSEPITPDNHSAWETTNVSGCTLTDDTTNDHTCFQDSLTTALAGAAGGAKLYVPAGTYNFTDSTSFTVNRDNFVIECESPETTHLVWEDKISNCSGSQYGYPGGICFNSGTADGSEVDWTGGYSRGDTIITVDDDSGFSTGDWVVLGMDLQEGCFHDVGSNLTDSREGSFNHQAKISCKDGEACDTDGTLLAANQMQIDRPLRMDYDGDEDCVQSDTDPGTTTIQKRTMIESVGIESCDLVTTDTEPVCSYSGASVCCNYGSASVVFEHVANGWSTDNYHRDFCNRTLWVAHSSHILSEGELHQNTGQAFIDYQTTGIGVAFSSDVWILNNILDHVKEGGMNSRGAEGVVWAYNYQPSRGDNPNWNERSVFSHGSYPRETLIEGNDLYAAPQLEGYWGNNGPRITFYRNRLLPTLKDSLYQNQPTVCFSSAYNDTRPHIDLGPYSTFIGNVGHCMVNGSPLPWKIIDDRYHSDIDLYLRDLYLELNMVAYYIDLASPEADTDCGSGGGPGDCTESPINTYGRNVQYASIRPAGWTTLEIPDSLFLEDTPNWWCREACPFNQWGIGSLGDKIGTCTGNADQPCLYNLDCYPYGYGTCDGAGSTSGLRTEACRIPARLRYELGPDVVCTSPDTSIIYKAGRKPRQK